MTREEILADMTISSAIASTLLCVSQRQINKLRQRMAGAVPVSGQGGPKLELSKPGRPEGGIREAARKAGISHRNARTAVKNDLKLKIAIAEKTPDRGFSPSLACRSG